MSGPELRRRPEPVALRGHPGVEVTAPLSVTEFGFSLHAATHAGAEDAPGREALCKYVLRPPLAQERLSLLPDGLVRITLSKPFRDGTYAVDMDPLSLLCRLATMIPPPRIHVVRYSGVLATWESRPSPGSGQGAPLLEGPRAAPQAPGADRNVRRVARQPVTTPARRSSARRRCLCGMLPLPSPSHRPSPLPSGSLAPGCPPRAAVSNRGFEASALLVSLTVQAGPDLSVYPPVCHRHGRICDQRADAAEAELPRVGAPGRCPCALPLRGDALEDCAHLYDG